LPSSVSVEPTVGPEPAQARGEALVERISESASPVAVALALPSPAKPSTVAMLVVYTCCRSAA
jgi:hypothetical protein